jgi:hypothetical protein
MRMQRIAERYRASSLLQAVVTCVLVAGTLDISDALIFYGIRGTPPLLLLQVIASGVLGRPALRGGVAVALAGLAIHYLITSIWVTIFFLILARFPVIRRYPTASGTLYGLIIYVVMNFVVLPHSHYVGHHSFRMPVFPNAVLALVFCIGLPIAHFSSVYFARGYPRQPVSQAGLERRSTTR